MTERLRRLPTPPRPRGIALITALLVMALSAIAAAAVMVGAQSSIRRSATLLDGEKAWWYATGLESWVRAVLQRDPNGGFDALGEDWAQPIDYLPVEQGVLRGRLEDLQGRFNLNNFYSATAGPPNAVMTAQFERLFANIDDLECPDAKALAEAIKDWVDPDSINTGSGGAEDADYTSLDRPYRAANQPMKSPSELLAVNGMTPDCYRLLAPNVTALPVTTTPGAAPQLTKINANTALAPVLMSLSPGMNASNVASWIEDRKLNPHGGPAGGNNSIYEQAFPADSRTLISDTTSYFQMTGEAFIGTGRVALYSVLFRPAPGAAPIVITRSLDTE